VDRADISASLGESLPLVLMSKILVSLTFNLVICLDQVRAIDVSEDKVFLNGTSTIAATAQHNATMVISHVLYVGSSLRASSYGRALARLSVCH